eukprot:729282-Amorphochlora_amoeboformis.AAC.1
MFDRAHHLPSNDFHCPVSLNQTLFKPNNYHEKHYHNASDHQHVHHHHHHHNHHHHHHGHH